LITIAIAKILQKSAKILKGARDENVRTQASAISIGTKIKMKNELLLLDPFPGYRPMNLSR